MNYHQQKPPVSWGLISVYVVVSTVLLILGILFVGSQRETLLKEKENELATVANLKIGQIHQWRFERIGFANVIHDNPSLAGQVYDFLNKSDSIIQKAELIKWMRSILVNYDYQSIKLTDINCRIRLSVPEADTLSDPYITPYFRTAIDSQKIIIADIHRLQSTNNLHLDFIIPMVRYNKGDSLVTGLLILSVNPKKILFPLIENWPTPSKTSETLILRKDGDSLVYLNSLKYIPNSSLTIRKSLNEENLLGALAVAGFKGIAEGVDYRNVAVIGAIKKIHDSPWYIVSKMDTEEIYSSFRERLSLAILLIIFFISSLSGIIGWMIWHQRMRFYRQRYEAEVDRQAVRKHFDYILKYANDIILLIDQDLNIIEVNDKAVEIYQYSREELIGMEVVNLRDPAEAPQLAERIMILNEIGYSRYETIHRCKDGTTFPLEISARLVEIEGIKYFQVIARDITERRKIEANLHELLERYNLATNAAKLAVWDWDIVKNELLWDDRVYELFAVEKGAKPPAYESWLEIVYPEDLEKCNSEIAKALKGEKNYDTEFRIMMPDSSLRHIKAYGHVVRDPGGEPIRMIGINYDITVQKNAENLLREREFWLSESQRVGKIGSYILDIKLNQWTCSEVLDDIFGITPDAPKTIETWNNLVHPDQREEMLNYFLHDVVEAKKSFDREYRIIRYNSIEDSWVWGRGELSYDIDGNPEKMFGTIQDITDRKISELLIIESEDRFRKMFEESPISTAMTSNSFNILRVNSSFCKMMGYKEKEIIDLTFRDFTHPDNIEQDEKSLNDLIKGKITIYRTEKRYIRKDNSVLWGSTTVSSVKDRNGSTQYFLVMIEDITHRKEAVNQIEESNSLLLATLESTADGILVVDTSGKIVQFNRKFSEMWRIPESILATRNDDGAITFVKDQLKEPDSFVDNVKHLYQSPDSVSYDSLLFKDGRVFERYSQPQKIGNKIIGRVWSFRDITERKIAEDQLVNAKEKAEESDRLKTAFLHNISHEIRTPMNAIVGFTGLLDDNELLPENRRHYIDIIYQSSNQLLSIISDIVDISNIETGLTRVNKTSINVNSMILNLHEQFNIKAITQGLTFNYRLALNDDEAKMETDGTKLIQILTNLLSNAFKFTKAGQIEFGYSLNESLIEFVVRDTGIGISKDKQTKIFDRFYQVENSISRQYGGTGLGLSICTAYANLMGGYISVESSPGEGSTFYLRLPFISDEKNEEIKESKHKKSDRLVAGKTILIAEDDDINFLVVKKSLERDNLILLRAENGQIAVDICKTNNEIDLVLLDLKMPVMEGLEAMRLIKEFRPDLPFVALTAYAFETDKKNAIEKGCSDYISKPFSKKDLIDIVGKYL